MGVCVVDQCLTNSMVGKGTRLYGIPKVRAQYGEYELDLSQRRRNGFLAAIGRKDSASLHNAPICSLPFIKGKPAQSLYSELVPDWLPSLNLPGICKKSPSNSDIERLLRYSKRRRAATKREQNANKKCSVPGVAAKSNAMDSELNESSGGMSTETMCVCSMSFTHPLTNWL